MMDPLPSINKVFSYATQQERQLNGTVNLNNLSLINATSASHSRNLCSYYGKNGHVVEDCWKKKSIWIYIFVSYQFSTLLTNKTIS